MCKNLLYTAGAARHSQELEYTCQFTFYMKKKIAFSCIVLGLVAKSIFAQTKDAYVLPATYHFDREIIQVTSGKKDPADSARFNSYYTNSGEFTGIKLQGEGAKHTGWVIVARNGNTVFFNEKEKTATVISMRKIFSDLEDLAKWIKMDSVMAGMRRRMDGKKVTSVKTGKTKTIDGYSAQEYSVTDSSGRVSLVWCAKVDFPVMIDYILNAGAGKWMPVISSKLQTNPLLQAIVSAGTIVTDIQLTDSGRTYNLLRTDLIRQVPTDFPTNGYTVKDYSNSSLMEIFRAEMRRSLK
jgi:hypothetical protein